MGLLRNLLSKVLPKKKQPEEIKVQNPEAPAKGLVARLIKKFKPKKVKKKEQKKEINEEIKTTIPKPPKSPKKIRDYYYDSSGRPKGETPIDEPPLKSDIILQELERRISTWEADLSNDEVKGHRTSVLKNILNDEINRYGRAKVAYSCEQSGAIVITNAAVYVFDSDDNKREVALTMFTMIIRGEALNMNDAKNIGDELDNQAFDVDDDLGFY